MSSLQVQGRLTAPGAPPLDGRVRHLAWASVGWHAVEFGVAVAAGIGAGSVALVAFGADSVIEAAAGGVIVWRFSRSGVRAVAAERRAQQLVAASYGLLVVYVGASSIRALALGDHPASSRVGIGLAALTLVAMPALAGAKRRAARRVGSAAALSEAAQNQLCAYLSAALLVGLLSNALAGWWWADPAAALVIAGAAAREAVLAWRGESCDCC